jgi:hypothetical protein
MRASYFVAAAVVVAVASAAALHFYPGAAFQGQQGQQAQQTRTSAPLQPNPCQGNATSLCRDIGGLPE